MYFNKTPDKQNKIKIKKENQDRQKIIQKYSYLPFWIRDTKWCKVVVPVLSTKNR